MAQPPICLTEADRHGVHEMRAASLDDVVRFVGPALQLGRQMIQRGQEVFAQFEVRRQHGSRRE